MSPQKGLWSALALTTTIGIYISVALAIGVGVGIFADRMLGSKPWFSIIGSIVGLAAGATGAYRIVMKEMNNP